MSIRNSLLPICNTVSRMERNEFIKINFTFSEKKVFNLDEKQVIKFYAENGLIYNQQEHFRVILLNLNNPEFLKLILSHISKEHRLLFGMGK